MRIVDLSADNADVIQQAAVLLVEGFATHWPNAWPDMKAALAEVRKALEPGKINRIAVDDDGVVLGWVGALPEYEGNAWEPPNPPNSSCRFISFEYTGYNYN